MKLISIGGKLIGIVFLLKLILYYPVICCLLFLLFIVLIITLLKMTFNKKDNKDNVDALNYKRDIQNEKVTRKNIFYLKDFKRQQVIKTELF
ncbi:MAG: hypothetical protein H0U57_06640 [Tatlockia sp.]|nr:hypothetical protein [Tatlockia sp.]